MNKIFSLPIFLACMGWAAMANAGVCFVIGGDCGEDVKHDRNCSDLGYKYKACEAGTNPDGATCCYTDQGYKTTGAKCDEFYEGCVCDTSKYPYLVGENHDPYILTGDPCPDDNGVYKKYKVCPSEYKYSSVCDDSSINCQGAPKSYVGNIIGSAQYTTGKACKNNSVLGGDMCEEKYPVDVVSKTMGVFGSSSTSVTPTVTNEVKYTKCVCDKEKYRYTKTAQFDKDVFVFSDKKKCVNSDNEEYYGTPSCNKELHGNYYYTEGECNDGYERSSSGDKTITSIDPNISFTCHKCLKEEKCGDNIGEMAEADCISMLNMAENAGKRCRPQGTIAGCFILEEGGVCPSDTSDGIVKDSFGNWVVCQSRKKKCTEYDGYDFYPMIFFRFKPEIIDGMLCYKNDESCQGGDYLYAIDKFKYYDIDSGEHKFHTLYKYEVPMTVVQYDGEVITLDETEIEESRKYFYDGMSEEEQEKFLDKVYEDGWWGIDKYRTWYYTAIGGEYGRRFCVAPNSSDEDIQKIKDATNIDYDSSISRAKGNPTRLGIGVLYMEHMENVYYAYSTCEVFTESYTLTNRASSFKENGRTFYESESFGVGNHYYYDHKKQSWNEFVKELNSHIVTHSKCPMMRSYYGENKGMFGRPIEDYESLFWLQDPGVLGGSPDGDIDYW